jgi:cell division septation protein DedD
MDNNSTDDTDKRNWRERLGVGSKAMPRISEEFAKPVAPPPEMSRANPKVVQPVSVAKPAPMAPRVAPKPAPQIVKSEQQQAPAQNARPAQPSSSSPQSPDVLAEKLRSQRAAAEKLAEQRVLAARDRAESPKPSPSVAPPPAKPMQSAGPAGTKPKFTFADEGARSEANRETRPVPPPARPPQRPMQQSPLQPQLSPPRPSLGGDRTLGGPARPNGPPPGYQPTFRPQPPQGYRPIDPATGYVPPSQTQPQRGYNPGPSLGEPRLQQPRMNPDAFRRLPAQDEFGYPTAGYEPSSRAMHRQEPLRAQPQSLDDDYADDIFEDAAPSRATRRASATDYNQAYRETEDGYADEGRRSSGPWLLLLFLLLAAGAAGAGVWYYQTKIKSGTATTASSSESAPVIPAPDTSAKVAPEQPADGQPTSAGVTPSKKQIYDRIVGDNEVLGGRVVPTEEVPVQPAAQSGSAQQVPQPAGATAQPSGDGSGEALPLPLPPPPGADTQGALPAPNGSASVAAADPALNKTTTQLAAASDAVVPPTPGSTASTGSAATTTQASPPSDVEPAKEEIVSDDAGASKKKPAVKEAEAPVKAKAKSKNKSENAVALGAKPVVLVPPADNASATESSGDQIVVDQPIAANQPVATPQPPVKKKKTLLGLFNGTNDEVAAAEAASVEPPKQVANIQNPAPAPALKSATPAQAASAGGGYYVQLASFKSQAEATTEYGRMKAKHPDIIGGLSPVINPATVGGSTRYRLALGPLSSRDEASGVCNSLVSAGERDCLVRKQ